MKKTYKLGYCLALTLAAGAAVTSAEGATTVTVYGQGVTPPAGINPAWRGGGTAGVLDQNGRNGSFFANSYLDSGSLNSLFTRGGDLGELSERRPQGDFAKPGNDVYVYGAQWGDSNYANISLNGDDGVYESVGQFHIGESEIWLIALAQNDDHSALSISAGKAAINAETTSAVPEASTSLGLLALGAGGLLTRRRLKRAA